MLEGQNGCRNQNRHLLAVRHRLESGSYRHLGLSETHIPAHEPVHRISLFHVGLDSLRGLFLIRSILIYERGLQFLLHVSICGKRETLGLPPFGIQVYEVFGYVFQLALRRCLEVLPCLASQFVYLRFFFRFRRLVPGYLMQ